VTGNFLTETYRGIFLIPQFGRSDALQGCNFSAARLWLIPKRRESGFGIRLSPIFPFRVCLKAPKSRGECAERRGAEPLNIHERKMPSLAFLCVVNLSYCQGLKDRFPNAFFRSKNHKFVVNNDKYLVKNRSSLANKDRAKVKSERLLPHCSVAI